MNAKDHFLPVPTSTSFFSTWPGFRQFVSMCREVSSPTQLRSISVVMLEECMPESPNTNDRRIHLVGKEKVMGCAAIPKNTHSR